MFLKWSTLFLLFIPSSTLAQESLATDVVFSPIWLLAAAACLAILPLLIGLTTSYVKVSIVLSLLRSGLGAQQVPGPLVIVALSVALSLYIMTPVIEKSYELSKQYDFNTALSNPSFESLRSLGSITRPWREFMLKHSGQKELLVLLGLRTELNPHDFAKQLDQVKKDLPLKIVVPAFVLTELKQAFSMGFLLLLPFLVIDLVVANIMVGMGMFMVSPVMVSLPLKLLLIVLSDAWILLTKGLIQSY